MIGVRCKAPDIQWPLRLTLPVCPPIQWRHQLGIRPQPAPLALRPHLNVGVLLAAIWWQSLGVASD